MSSLGEESFKDQFLFDKEVPIESLRDLGLPERIETEGDDWAKFIAYYTAYTGYRIGGRDKVDLRGITPQLVGKILRLQRAVAIYGIGEIRRNPDLAKSFRGEDRKNMTKGMEILAGWERQTSRLEKHPYHEFIELYNRIWAGKIFGKYGIDPDRTASIFRACRKTMCFGLDNVIAHTEKFMRIKVYA